MKTFADNVHNLGVAIVGIDGHTDLKLTPGESSQLQELTDVFNELSTAKYTVIADEPGSIGTAGALVYALATNRVVSSGVMVPKLPAGVGSLCAAPCSRAFWGTLAGHAGDGITVTSESPRADRLNTDVLPAQGGGGSTNPWLLLALIVAAIAALWFAGGNRVVRRLVARPAVGVGLVAGDPDASWGGPAHGVRGPGNVRGGQADQTRPLSAPRYESPQAGRRPSLTRTEQAARNGPGQGVVRTAMGPEGYVEIDGVLYRATWRGSQAAPRRGTVVAIVSDNRGELAAVEDGSASGGSGPAWS
jgi:hypothetical protein